MPEVLLIPQGSLDSKRRIPYNAEVSFKAKNTLNKPDFDNLIETAY